MHLVVKIAIICFLVGFVSCQSDKYGEEENKDPILSYSGLENPFRMQKVNLLWNKARPKLAEEKLKRLYSELKIQDKEELALKKLKAERMDKEGLREAEVRKKFNSIMYAYGLASPSSQESVLNNKNLKVFKDKKLERLWEKAQKSGLTDEELMLLKKEFQHHQEKLDQYHRLKELHVSTEDGNRQNNEIKWNYLDDDEENDFDPNTLNGKAKAIKDDFERLHRLAVNSVPAEFKEPKVQGLWRLAQEADFDTSELDSLRQELHHYEKRVEKLHFMDAELKLVDSRPHDIKEKTDGRKIMDRKLAKHEDSVKKIHAELAAKILARHSEL